MQLKTWVDNVTMQWQNIVALELMFSSNQLSLELCLYFFLNYLGINWSKIFLI